MKFYDRETELEMLVMNERQAERSAVFTDWTAADDGTSPKHGAGLWSILR